MFHNIMLLKGCATITYVFYAALFFASRALYT